MSQDFQSPFFSWFKPIWAPDKQAKEKEFLNSVSILQRYSITKFETFDSGVCMTQRVKNFRLGKSKTILQIFSFMTDVFTLKEFLLIVPLKATRNSQRFWFWLIGVQFDSAVWCTPQSLTQQWDAHRGAWLSSRKHTAELDSVVWCTPRSFLKIWISRRNQNWIRKYFSLFIRGLDGFESWKKNWGQKSWDTLPLSATQVTCLGSTISGTDSVPSISP